MVWAGCERHRCRMRGHVEARVWHQVSSTVSPLYYFLRPGLQLKEQALVSGELSNQRVQRSSCLCPIHPPNSLHYVSEAHHPTRFYRSYGDQNSSLQDCATNTTHFLFLKWFKRLKWTSNFLYSFYLPLTVHIYEYSDLTGPGWTKNYMLSFPLIGWFNLNTNYSVKLSQCFPMLEIK